MTPSQGTTRTVTAFFDNRESAEDAIRRLNSEGVTRDSIRLIQGAQKSGTASSGTEDVGFWESLKDLFLPDEDRHTYAEGLKRGGFLVTVQTSVSNYERVLDILDDEGTIDVDQRAASWRSEGWTGYSGSDYRPSATGTAKSMSRAPAQGREDVIPVTEEELRVGKRDVSGGRVRVRSYVVETPVQESVNLRQEHVSVERRPVDRAAAAADNAFRERTVEAEERAEEAVVAKEARVKEEVVLKKRADERTETVTDKLRKTKVEVEDDRVGNSTLRDQSKTR
jgi:uncharacterized protein (TIGR02271 family)